MPQNEIEKIMEEFDKMTPDEIPCSTDDLYEKGGVSEWLKENTVNHLFSDGIYGEPMCDLDKDKISDWLKSALTRIHNSALKEIEERMPKDKQCLFKNTGSNITKQCSCPDIVSFNALRSEVSELLKSLKK